jgi:hypothetical protein
MAFCKPHAEASASVVLSRTRQPRSLTTMSVHFFDVQRIFVSCAPLCVLHDIRHDFSTRGRRCDGYRCATAASRPDPVPFASTAWLRTQIRLYCPSPITLRYSRRGYTEPGSATSTPHTKSRRQRLSGAFDR